MKRMILHLNALAIVLFVNSCSSFFHPSPSTLPPDNWLHKAVVDNDVEEVKKLIKNPFRNINAKCRGRTALAYAVQNDNYEIAKILLESGATPDIPVSVTGLSPIHIASSRGDLEIVKLLIEHGSNPQLQADPPNSSWTPLSAAKSQSRYKVIEFLENVIKNKELSNEKDASNPSSPDR